MDRELTGTLVLLALICIAIISVALNRRKRRKQSVKHYGQTAIYADVADGGMGSDHASGFSSHHGDSSTHDVGGSDYGGGDYGGIDSSGGDY